MPTDKPRFTITLDEETNEILDHYWKNSNYRSKNDAINALIKNALASGSLSSDDRVFIERYREAPTIAKDMVNSALVAASMYIDNNLESRNLKNLGKHRVKPISVSAAKGITAIEDEMLLEIMEKEHTSTLAANPGSASTSQLHEALPNILADVKKLKK